MADEVNGHGLPTQPPNVPTHSPRMPAMGTITVVVPSDDSSLLMEAVERIRNAVADIPGAALDVRYRTMASPAP